MKHKINYARHGDLIFSRALDYYWQYGTYHQRAINDLPPYKEEMDRIEMLSVKMLSE